MGTSEPHILPHVSLCWPQQTAMYYPAASPHSKPAWIIRQHFRSNLQLYTISKLCSDNFNAQPCNRLFSVLDIIRAVNGLWSVTTVNLFPYSSGRKWLSCYYCQSFPFCCRVVFPRSSQLATKEGPWHLFPFPQDR